MQRSTMQEAIAAPEVGGIVRLTLFILRGTAVAEGVGALMLLPSFCRDYGLRGIWMAVFHAVSSFCNAGFDILGTANSPYSSLTAYAADAGVVVPIMLLILLGGIGFLTWEDVCTHRLHLRRYRLQSKVILITSAVLLVLPALFYFFVDFADQPLKERVLLSLFQAVTPRTAGFNTADFSSMTDMGRGIMTVLMIIGGSPGSTAGGLKTTTVAVLLINAVATFRRKRDAEVLGRRLDDAVVKNAATLLTMYITLFFGGAVVISLAEGLPFATCLFETASAVGTVGLTLGITPSLGVVSQAVLMLLMFLGRVGGLTLIFAAHFRTVPNVSRFPQEKISVG